MGSVTGAKQRAHYNKSTTKAWNMVERYDTIQHRSSWKSYEKYPKWLDMEHYDTVCHGFHACPHHEAAWLRGVQKPSNCKGLRVWWLFIWQQIYHNWEDLLSIGLVLNEKDESACALNVVQARFVCVFIKDISIGPIRPLRHDELFAAVKASKWKTESCSERVDLTAAWFWRSIR